ncbi:MAG: hypothetical protein ACRCSN_05205 [Dermatophilaceae bacterium]
MVLVSAGQVWMNTSIVIGDGASWGQMLLVIGFSGLAGAAILDLVDSWGERRAHRREAQAATTAADDDPAPR